MLSVLVSAFLALVSVNGRYFMYPKMEDMRLGKRVGVLEPLCWFAHGGESMRKKDGYIKRDLSKAVETWVVKRGSKVEGRLAASRSHQAIYF